MHYDVEQIDAASELPRYPRVAPAAVASGG